MKRYDIFISYRRSSYDTANLIATRLKSAGYSVFFDLETLRSGKFNEQLYSVIDNCKDFILVLPQNALDRCVDMDDWVRLEVCRAMANNKNIIPVMLNGFIWPDPMPYGMEELKNYQALTASSIEYFDLSMEQLQKRYILSKRHVSFHKTVKYVSVGLASLLAIVAILWGIFNVLSRDVCLKYATNIAMDAGYVHIIVEENKKLKNDWESFTTALNYEKKQDNIRLLENQMLDRIDLTYENITRSWNVDSVKLDIIPYHSFLLSLHGINSEEIALSPKLATYYYIDYLDQLSIIKNAIEEPSTYNRRFVSVLFDVFDHSINSYYASVLSSLSDFPEESMVTYKELSPRWIYFPIHSYRMGEDRLYYESIINTESQLIDDILGRFESVVEQNESDLEDIERKTEQLEKQIEDIQVYNRIKKNCTLNESDDQWLQWGKIRRWGAYISMLVEDGNDLQNTALNDMITILDEYQEYHPESEEYIESAKLFFSEVTESKRPYSGVLVFGFKDDMSHPTLEKGDIIIEYNDSPVKTYDEFCQAFKNKENAKTKFIRIENGKFVEGEFIWEETGIVGFLDLTENL